MTREEQIIKASHLYAKAFQKPFMDGAKWADEHPREMPTILIDEAPIDPDIQQVINDNFFDMI